MRESTVLGISPSTRIFGIALLEGNTLTDWRMIKRQEKWTQQKLKNWITIVGKFIERREIHCIAIKVTHTFRSSENLNLIISEVKALARKYDIPVHEYYLEELEMYFLGNARSNKKQLCECLSQQHPHLFGRLHRDERIKNKYQRPLFEAVACAMLCQNTITIKN